VHASHSSAAAEETAAQAIEERRYDEAFPQYVSLAESGSTTAQLRLAWMYLLGHGTARNLAEAERWYLKAAASGFPYAEYLLGDFYRRTERYDAAATWLGTSASTGYLPAMYALGVLYRAGAGVPRDLQRAQSYFEQAASRGHVFAMKEVASELFRSGGLRSKAAGARLAIRATVRLIRIARKNPQSDLILH